MRVVEGRAEHLAAGQVLEGRRDAPLDRHGGGVDRLADGDPRQGRAIGTQQEDRLDQIAARLLDGERRQAAIVERALGHHAVDRQRQLLVDLGAAQLGQRRIAAPRLGEQLVGGLDRGRAALHRDIHVRAPR